MNLRLQIRRHSQAIQNLQLDLDGVREAIENQTDRAHEKLVIYRELKNQTEHALDAVADEYEQASGLFSQADRLFQSLDEIKIEHDRLCYLAIDREDEKLLDKMRQARARLKEAYNEIRRLQAEARAFENTPNKNHHTELVKA